MSYFSYIDTALRVIHINRMNEGGGERSEKLNDLFTNLRASQDFKRELTLQNIHYNLQSPDFNSLLLHESHHYWQSLFYPYLFYINFLEFHSLSILRHQLELLPDEIIPLENLYVDPKLRHNLYYCSDKFLYSWKDDGSLDIRNSDLTDDSKYQSNVFSINDLIEDATTLFQYKAMHSDANADNYFRWVQNPANRGYKKLYKFLVKQFGVGYAYHFIPILVQLAFHTTEPASMFMNLVNITVHHGLYKENFSGKDYVWMKALLKSYVEPVQFSVPETLLINDMPVGFITPDFHRQIIEYAYSNPTSVHYPLSVHAKKHLDMLAADRQWEEALLNINPDNFNNILNTYSPFAIHFNFLDQKTRDTAVLINSSDYENIIINGQQLDYSYIIKEQLNMQDTTINLLFDIHRATPNQCNHEGCAYYPLQLCKKWNSIPKRHEDCRFPHWFPVHFSYKINPKERRLERITEIELQEYQEEYIRLQKAFGPSRFSYIFNGNRCRLNIKRKAIEEKDLEYIQDFIEEQLKEKDALSLAGFLTFHFTGYEEDTREVFEILDIREYIHQTFRLYPSLVYYLDLSDAETRGYVLPFFVQYENLTADDRSYTLRFDPRAFDKFINDTSYILIRFAEEQRLNVNRVLKSFLNQLK